ncbi:cell differentiation and development protein Fsr1 [Aspergillus vadensis CBS 113365]|uniref:Cell differentiation and development protein Fsr1/Pro11 n=1 Tax=Aspergillus vadensis (strain CBS 113365 / IMI 142717 / IBT 24658) TaxID=1448311 RepID=A0A319AXE1_ASPVC|nr:cell differentiation and development protein Fsr1/Pro11 [Aspergillus vadensis CBS 113365]PYH65036.1 cell differentiation and development protein Fsr1/Pro11 [Aspergillus vadensis CBS 113365]
MAWQSPSAMAGGGGYVGPGGDGSSNGGHPQGTEYTLQGVMRFLQTEWHRHERDRNAWEIERAEMKSRIGKLEGDVRTSKRLHESLGKHVRLLEAALKKEREKVKKLSNNEKVEDTRDPKEIAKESINSLKAQRPKPHTGPSDVDVNLENEHEYRQENEREKSRLYLSKCSQEVAYHVIPSSHPPPELGEQDLPNHIYGNQQLSQQSLEEAYLQQQRQKQHQQQQAQANDMMAREVALQNHQPVITHYADNAAMSRAQNQFGFPPATREAMERRPLEPQQTPLTAIDNRKQALGSSLMDERAGQGDQVYDGYGSQAAAKDAKQQRMEEQGDDADGWNFDEPAEPAPQAEQVPPHRPDVDAFPNANFVSSKSPQRSGSLSHRRKSSGARRKSDGAVDLAAGPKPDPTFKVRFALRGHLDVVRSVIFTGGGSPSEPEICTCSDDGTIKRWIIPATYGTFGASSSDLDITSYFTHRGHVGAVTALAACSPQNFSNGGRALGDGWVFSGGQDTSVRVWERGRVDPKATLDGHTDAVWGLCVLPGTAGSVLGESSSHYGGPDRILLASGGADGRIIIWAVSAPPQLSSPQAGSRRAGGSRRANSISSGSNFPSSPQPSTATTTPFHYSMVRQIVRTESPSPTCISPLSLAGINFVVSYTDASILVYDTRTGEEIVGMASLETYDGTPSTGVNSVVATTVGFDGSAGLDPSRTMGEEEVVHGATGSSGVEGVIISGYEDRYIRFFDANSGQCTYTMLAHPSAIASLSLSPDGRELVSAGHDASLRFWNLEKRSCTQEITSHRLMRGEGVCAAVWSRDGRWVVSGGGDGVVKVFSR